MKRQRSLYLCYVLIKAIKVPIIWTKSSGIMTTTVRLSDNMTHLNGQYETML